MVNARDRKENSIARLQFNFCSVAVLNCRFLVAATIEKRNRWKHSQRFAEYHVKIAEVLNFLVSRQSTVKLRYQGFDFLLQFLLNIRINAEGISHEVHGSGNCVEASEEENQALRDDVLLIPFCNK